MTCHVGEQLGFAVCDGPLARQSPIRSSFGGVSGQTETEAVAEKFLLASERDLPALVVAVLEQESTLGWLYRLLEVDSARGQLVLSIALDVVEGALAADESDEVAASMLAEVCGVLARTASAAGDEAGSRRILTETREVLRNCGWRDFERLVVAELFRMVLEQGDAELASQLSDELLRIVGRRELEPPLRELLLSAAHIAYYEVGDLDLAYRCADVLRPDPPAAMIAGFVLQREERWSEALEIWEELGDIGEGPGIELNHIVALANIGKGQRARAELEELLDRFPDYWKGLAQRSLFELECPGGAARSNLERTFALAVQEQIEPQQIGDAVAMVTSLARENGYADPVERAMGVLEDDQRAEVRLTAKYSRGLLLVEQARHAQAARRFGEALELSGEDEQRSSEIRLALVDALLASGQEEDAVDAIEPLVQPDGLPEEAASRLERLAAAQPSARVGLLRAMADYAEMKLAPAETELTALLAEDLTNVGARRLRGIVRLSTSLREDEESWNEAAGVERYLSGIDDLGRAAREGDAEALEAYRWAVDRARASWVLRGSLMFADTGEADQYCLIEGLAEAEQALSSALASIEERDWPSAVAHTEDARRRFERIDMPVEAGRQVLLLADLALRQSEPRRALDLLDDAKGLLALQLTPLEEESARQANETAAAAAARGAVGLALPLDYLFFLTGTALSTMAYRRIVRAQALSAIGRYQEALKELGDEDELLDQRGKLGLLELDGGESVRAAIAVLRDAGEPARALALRDRALLAADGPLRKVAILTTCAGCLLELGEPEKALTTLGEARAVEGVEGPRAIWAVVDHTEAIIQLERHAERSVELLGEQVIEDLGPAPRRAAGLMTKAYGLQALGRPTEAEAFARRVERLLDDHMASIALAADHSLSHRAWQGARRIRCSIAAERGDAEEMLVLLAGLKGRALAIQQAVTLAGPKPPSPVETTVAAERDDLLALLRHAELHGGAISWLHYRSLDVAGRSLIKRSPDGGPRLDIDKARAALKDARERLASLQVHAGELPAKAGGEELIDLSRVRAMLGDASRGTVLIDMLLDEDQCYLNGLAAGVEPWTIAVDCGEAEIRSLVTEVRQAGDWSDDNPVWTDQRLGRIVDAVQEKTSPGDHVVLIRHGPLHELPLHAVEGGAGTLAARNTISYAPGMGALLSCRAERPATGEAVVIADSLGDLPHARLEGQSVADLMAVSPLVGFRADRRRLLTAMGERAPSVLHVACHGLFDEEDPDASRLILAASTWGANGDGATDLTARDIARLPLQGAVVILSACHSGVNALKPGDEPFGLTRAFLTAGARAVVAARWAVDDVSTWLLMSKFTELRRLNGLGVVEALADAQRWVREMSAPEMTALCDAALREGGATSAAVVELLNRRCAQGLAATGRATDAEAMARAADLLATMPGPRSRGIRALKADERPFSDREYWAAFEVVGDWV